MFVKVLLNIFIWYEIKSKVGFYEVVRKIYEIKVIRVWEENLSYVENILKMNI